MRPRPRLVVPSPISEMFCVRCHREYEQDAIFCAYDGERLVPERHIDFFRGKPTRQVGVILGGRYAVRGYLGKGSMARVYLAEDAKKGEPVAVKVLDMHSTRGIRAKERFVRESQAANRIGHPNIVKLLDHGQRSDGAPYIVMEYLHGESLGDLLRREQRLKEDMALPVLIQAASGLAAAHRVGIVHRDVKPDNLFLVGEPGDPYGVKILDFGLAKLSEESGFTASGVAVGTLEYMSPEQTVTDGSDHRSDVYALGVVMFRLFTGQLPFRAKVDTDLLAHQLIVPMPAPSTLDPDIDPRIEQVIMKATRKRPENRYPTMEEFHADLERLMGDRSGTLLAALPLAHARDIYQARSAFAKHAARFFYKKLSMDPPTWEG